MSNDMSQEFEQLYTENYSKVFNLSIALTGSVSDAEEITQEAFFRALRHYESFRGGSSFFTWIYRITLNVASNYMTQRMKMPVQALTEDFGYSLEDIIDKDTSNNPECELLSKEARYKCLHCLTECLQQEQRKIFCLAITLGLPQKMVAEIMGCSLAKVKTTLCRAKQKWFGYMENRCDLIKKSNPCNCSQWVRFGIKQGWIKENEAECNLLPEVNINSLSEVRSLKALKNVYKTLYPSGNNVELIERIKKGIRNKEWELFS